MDAPKLMVTRFCYEPDSVLEYTVRFPDVPGREVPYNKFPEPSVVTSTECVPLGNVNSVVNAPELEFTRKIVPVFVPLAVP